MRNQKVPVDHEKMAAEVRSLGPSIFSRLIEEKQKRQVRPFINSLFLIYTFEKEFDRAAVLEACDIERAIANPAFNGREQEVLKYLHHNLRRFGDLVGFSHSIGFRHAVTSPIRVVQPGQLDNFATLPEERSLFADGFIAGLKKLIRGPNN